MIGASKPFPFRGGVGVGPVACGAPAVIRHDIPHPNSSPEGEGL
jgi:hypothetical protein